MCHRLLPVFCAFPQAFAILTILHQICISFDLLPICICYICLVDICTYLYLKQNWAEVLVLLY